MKEKIMADLRRWTKNYAVSRDAREDYLMREMPHTTRSKVHQAFEEFKQLIPRKLTPFQKLSLLYRCIASEATYDTTKKKAMSRSFLGALRDRNAMCGGFADLVTLLFGYVLEVPVYTVLGYTEPNPEKIDPDGTTHAWNIVCLPEGTFHLDLTWDLWKGQENKPAQYFLVGDKKINRTWCRECYPVAPRSYTGKMYEDDAVQKQLRAYYRELQQRFRDGISRLPETALLTTPKAVVEPSAFVTRREVKPVYSDFGQCIRKEVEVLLQAEGYSGCAVKGYYEGSHAGGDCYTSIQICIRL